MTTVDTGAVQLALRGLALACPQLPAARAWATRELKRTQGTAYVEEDFQPQPGQLYGSRLGGTVNGRGLYLLRVFYPSMTDLPVITTTLDALLASYPPGKPVTIATAGVSLRVRENPTPWRGGLLPGGEGFSLCVLTVAWETYSQNPTS